jgi:hypothetical protein
METDMMAQFLGADDHCFTYEHVDESMEALVALFLPSLDNDSNSSSSFLNYDVSPQCWPQPTHSSSVTSLLDPVQNFESFEFPVTNPLPPTDFRSPSDVPYFSDDLSPLHGNHSSSIEEEAANDAPATKKRKSSAAIKVMDTEILMDQLLVQLQCLGSMLKSYYYFLQKMLKSINRCRHQRRPRRLAKRILSATKMAATPMLMHKAPAAAPPRREIWKAI